MLGSTVCLGFFSLDAAYSLKEKEAVRYVSNYLAPVDAAPEKQLAAFPNVSLHTGTCIMCLLHVNLLVVVYVLFFCFPQRM